MAEIKYKFEGVMIVSGTFMLLTMYELPVASYFESIIYYRCFQQTAVQLLVPLVFQTLIPTYNDGDEDDGSALFWILDFIEYSMYFTTIYLVKRVITLLDLF
ncbi:uncharacterized protein LOC100570270 isoform X1 [Acyrthosiphon pisum]|uniref:Uncharacterized protein n=1 Tax=Acyrthosiphon pisum TaxID=7029 RepID=A0A8R1W670_ACYPI|nr:uncharacterized protein LOC100570270 isoform X1 [Acyrthosiphon pisum]|eukprot:XP_003246331.1 PREDICTED: uncharacterized protein LOC100570270 isoform X1 [Acyrthosiphon pisum]